MTNNLYNLYVAKNEYNPIVKDKYNRTPYYTYGGGGVFQPEVSNFLFNEGFNPVYPKGSKFAICLSHDVDELFFNGSKKYIGGMRNLADIALFELKQRFFKKKRHIDSNCDLTKTIERELKYNIISTFFFLSLDEKEQDFNYNPNEIQNQLKLVKEVGSEIGLHGGHNAYLSIEKLIAEKKMLEAATRGKITGHRNHYLKFITPHSWYNQFKAGLLYDTTFGFADCVGFRNGMCYPFMPYDDEKKQFIDIIELPLMIMDVSLLKHMKLTLDESKKIIKYLIEKVKQVNGVVTFLWHNNYMQGEMGDFYDYFLNYISTQDAWITTSNELVRWYKDKGYIKQINDIIENKLIK